MNKFLNHKMVFWSFLCIFTITVSGCSAIDRKNADKKGSSPFNLTRNEKPPAPLYYDFKDVLIPGELTENHKYTSVIDAGGEMTGFMVFYGRVESDSIIRFFNIKMPEDGWNKVSVIKSPISTNMVFHKKLRWCVITVKEKGFTTDVEIGIAPEIAKK